MLKKIRYFLSFPPHVIIKKIRSHIKEILRAPFIQLRHEKTDLREKSISNPIYYSFFDLPITSRIQIDPYQFLIDHWLDHRFNLLGSGWVYNQYSTQACGIEGYKYHHNLSIEKFDNEGTWLKEIIPTAHFVESKKYWRIIQEINPNYIPIDWQKDFKSGFRWKSKKWHRTQSNISKGVKGVDIKTPWELSRLQHLPQLAILGILEKSKAKQLMIEFQCQVLDFLSTNPIGLGVNFACTMDVGIRVANLLVAYDLFQQHDHFQNLDEHFKSIFEKNIFHYGEFILNNLEYKDGVNNNHYLANIAGLLFIAAYSKSNSTTDQWLAFAIQELIYCIDHHFFEDGTNFEGSTGYHMFSSEMLTWSTFLIQRIPRERLSSLSRYTPGAVSKSRLLKPLNQQQFLINKEIILPDSFFDKLYRSILFIANITGPNLTIPAIGDHDSGRFLKIFPFGQLLTHRNAIKIYKNLKAYGQNYDGDFFWDENDLSPIPLLALGGLLFDNQILNYYKKLHPIISSFKPTPITLSKSIESNTIKSNFIYNSWNSIPLEEYKFTSTKSFTTDTNNEQSFTDNLKFITYPNFQLTIIKSDRLFLTFSGLSNPKMHSAWGHVHNDKLSITLFIDNKSILIDPGTYLYTPIPEKRLAFRSVTAHATLIVEEIEQNNWPNGNTGLFVLDKSTRIDYLALDQNSIALQLSYKKIKQIRRIEILSNAVKISDFSNVPFKSNFTLPEFYSNGYGKLLKIRNE